MKKVKTPYSKLHEISKVSAYFQGVEALLGWDQETYMPPEGIQTRSHQIEQLASLVHKHKTSTPFKKALSALIDIESGQIHDKTLPLPEQAALREWRRDYLHATKLPNSFVKKFAKASSAAIHVWADARKKNDFKLFAPHLDKIVSLCRKKADYLGFQEHPYDALVDLYEPEMKTSILNPLFEKLKIELMQLLKSIGTRAAPDSSFLRGEFSKEAQLHYAHFILKTMGFNEANSRLDQSAHPFCSGMGPKDVRMTTHIHLDQLMPSIFAVIHEAGHALYDQGLPIEHYGSPLGEAISLGIHESQSRLWETVVGHSHPFWQYCYPKLQHAFPTLATVSLDSFFHAINTVKPTMIRIHADEVTYCLHIILRFEIEKAFIEGNLKVKDLPEVWNEKMRESFGIVPKAPSEGCMQDIHWSMGALGYFPTYALGNLYATQFFATFEKTAPHWKQECAQGNLQSILHWLRENIHCHGRRYAPQELCKHVTGSPLSHEPYIHYLTQKFSKLYQL